MCSRAGLPEESNFTVAIVWNTRETGDIYLHALTRHSASFFQEDESDNDETDSEDSEEDEEEEEEDSGGKSSGSKHLEAKGSKTILHLKSLKITHKTK